MQADLGVDVTYEVGICIMPKIGIHFRRPAQLSH